MVESPITALLALVDKARILVSVEQEELLQYKVVSLAALYHKLDRVMEDMVPMDHRAIVVVLAHPVTEGHWYQACGKPLMAKMAPMLPVAAVAVAVVLAEV